MATYGSVDITGEVWGFDCAMAGVLTEAQLVALYQTPLVIGGVSMLLRFLWGYVPLPGNKSSWDMTAAQLKVAADIGYTVLLVQHCRSGSWTASAAQGAADGQHAAEYAASIDYGDGHLAADDESLRNPGPDAIAHFTAWCRAPKNPLIYEGFDPGMNPQQEYEIPDTTAYWGAYGPWNVAKRGVRCRQTLQVTHCGVGIDPDRAAPDNFGGVLRGFARLPIVPPVDPDATIQPTA